METRVQELVRQLDSPSFSQREEATRALIDLGDDARPHLKRILENREDLSTEQKQSIGTILKEGPMGLLERASGLPEQETKMLRALHLRQTDHDDRWEIGQQIRTLLDAPDLNDAGLALIVRAILPNLPDLSNENRDEELIDRHTVFNLLERASNHENAGKATVEALARWMQDWYIPQVIERKDDSHHFGLHDANEIAKRVLVQDRLDADGFELLFQAYCKRVAGPGRIDHHAELGTTKDVIIGFAYSRHASSRHIGELAQALLTRIVIHAEHGGWGDPVEALDIVTASPQLTEIQARGVLNTLLRADAHASFDDDKDQLLGQLTGHEVWRQSDFDATLQEVMLRRPQIDAMKRWRQWWSDHHDDELLAHRKTGKVCRYVLVELDLSKEQEPEVRIGGDVRLRAGVPTVLRPPAGPAEAHWVRLRKAGLSPSREWTFILRHLAPDGVVIERTTVRDSGGSGGHTQLLSPGRPEFTGHRSGSRNNQSFKYITIEGVYDLGRDPGPDEAQLKDPAYWVRAATKTTARLYGRLQAEEELELLEQYLAPRYGPLNLERYRNPHLEEIMKEWLAGDEPGLSAMAALVLTRWEIDIDTAPLLAMLDADRPEIVAWAAEALTRAGEPEGVRHLIRQLKTQGTAADAAYTTLVKLADEHGFEPQTKADLAAGLIAAVLPREETPDKPVLREVLLVEQWTGHDFGYHLGAEPSENTQVLQRYHEWARDPKPPEPPEEEKDSEEQQVAPSGQEG